jgi:hypothetical protein
MTSLQAYDNQYSYPQGIYQNYPIKLVGKEICVGIEIVDAPLDYNLFLI